MTSPIFVFLDASALICLVEGAEPFASRVRRDLSDLDVNRPAVNVALSRLTWLEYRVLPLREANRVVLDAYDSFFRRPDRT